MEKHPEFQSVDDPELQGIFDALELAFFNTSFEDCGVDALPYSPSEDEVWSNCKTRMKTGFDAITRSHVEVAQFRYKNAYNDSAFIDNILVITSEDESDVIITLLIDLISKDIAYAVIQEDGTHDSHGIAEGDDIARFTLLTKQLLSCVTEI